MGIGITYDEQVESQDDEANSEIDSHPVDRPPQMVSKLPRRAVQHPTVAELVKRYQEYLPPQGVEELAKTALSAAAAVSENEQDGPRGVSPRPHPKSKARQSFLARKSSMSDFEHSYAANIAPKYLTHARKPIANQAQQVSRIPGPMVSSFDSRAASRRSSPDKRPSVSRMHTEVSIRGGRTSPTPTRQGSTGPFGHKNKGKSTIRALPKEKTTLSRPASSSAPKSTIKRASAPGNKVSNIAKHFERIGRDNERANRRYAVIRGRRARPVTTARARVEILDSIKDVMKDDEESDDSCSSEADDEGGGDEEDNGGDESSSKGSQVIAPAREPNPIRRSEQTLPLSQILEDGSRLERPAMVLDAPKEDKLAEPPTTEVHILNSAPISPAMPPIPYTPTVSPPELDLSGVAGERNSLFKTLAGFWPQQTQGNRHNDNDDPMSDPEHIFRDSSMVVRTDEPTSIIALALK